MSAYVVDASVAVKWSLPEEHSEQARRLRSQPHLLYAPNLLWLELASVICQRVQRNQLTRADGLEMFSAFRDFPIQVFSSTELIDPALSIALDTGISLYDSVYVALAVLVDATMVTADRPLYRKLAAGSLADRMLWVGDIP